MKFQKLFLRAVTGCLLVGASGFTMAQTVQVDSTGTNAYGILNLPVLNLETQETINYDVTFRFEPGQDVYPEIPDSSDFDFFDETVFSALDAVVDALNSVPSVTTVGPENEGGQSTFRIGVTRVALYDWIVSVTGKYLPTDWAREGVDVTNPGEKATYADFTEVTTE